MSFRTRLGLFFLLMVAIPIAAIAVLVTDITGDSADGKADARLSTGLETAIALYERHDWDFEVTPLPASTMASLADHYGLPVREAP